MKMDYEKDIEIDESALDIEWLEQPRLMLKYAKNAAEMQLDLDKAKQDLDIAKAEADKAIRENPERFGLEKVTEAAVSNAILISKDYKQAYQTYLDTKYEVDMARGAVNAFEQRKSALENLVRLHGQQYFAGPRVPHDLKELRAEKQKQIETNIGKRLNRSK
jgi:hypothetical protein